jgi:ParB-like chromosome segregation protein Spo0J
MTEYEIHEAANIYPLDEEHLPELVEDIRANGLIDEIDVFEGKVIDGRRRLLACQKAGVDPRFRTIVTSDPIAYVVSKQTRRDLTVSQRAMAADKARDWYAAHAKERQRASGGDRKSAASKSVPVPTPEPISGDTRDHVGKAFGVAGTTVDAARKVRQRGIPELVRAVEEGAMPVYPAAKLAEKPPEEQRKELSGSTAPEQPEDDSEEPESDEDRERLQKQKGKAVEAAHEAINCLMKIRRDNPGRARAFQMVRDWMKTNS